MSGPEDLDKIADGFVPSWEQASDPSQEAAPAVPPEASAAPAPPAASAPAESTHKKNQTLIGVAPAMLNDLAMRRASEGKMAAAAPVDLPNQTVPLAAVSAQQAASLVSQPENRPASAQAAQPSTKSTLIGTAPPVLAALAQTPPPVAAASAQDASDSLSMGSNPSGSQRLETTSPSLRMTRAASSSNLDDDLNLAIPKKRTGVIYATLAAVVVALVGGFFVLTRAKDPAPITPGAEQKIATSEPEHVVPPPPPPTAAATSQKTEPTAEPAKTTDTAKTSEPKVDSTVALGGTAQKPKAEPATAALNGGPHAAPVKTTPTFPSTTTPPNTGSKPATVVTHPPPAVTKPPPAKPPAKGNGKGSGAIVREVPF